ncbi:MAG: hypothetical protein HUJ53_07800 [Holdemanella sp.]|nr:hypothetical protein [Holdemanella sp.]
MNKIGKYLALYVICVALFCGINYVRGNPINIITNMILALFVVLFQIYRDKQRDKFNL